MTQSPSARNAAWLVPPGESATLELDRDLSAHVVRGEEPGPVVWAWAPHGAADPSMAQALGELRDRLSPAEMAGAVGLLIDGPPPPVAREAYRWSAAIRAVTEGADAVVLLSGPPAPYVEVAHAELDVGDPAARKLGRALGARFVLPMKLSLNRSLVTAPVVWWRDGESERMSRTVIDRAADALGSLLGTLGVTRDPPLRPDVRVVLKQVVTVELGNGVLEPVVQPGEVVEKGQPLAYQGPPGTRERSTVRAPVSGLVLYLPTVLSPGHNEIAIGKLTRSLPKVQRARARSRESFDLGWCEHVSLPELGLRLRAKVDTGARSCALHVTAMREIGYDHDGNVLVDIELPDERGVTRTMRVWVVEYAHVKDSGGHTERRPVIDTLLSLGGRAWRVRVTLTDRGDMRFPMLIGRTALTADMRVHPTRRYLATR
jgi:hypothetical protein